MLQLPPKPVIVFLCLVAGLLSVQTAAQEKADTARGKITYLTGEAVYVSVGRDAGLVDSAIVTVVERGDTVAWLRVFATSSRSAACLILRTKRKLAVNDIVVVPSPVRPSGGAAPPAVTAVSRDTLKPGADIQRAEPRGPLIAPFITVRGRVSLQILSTIQSNGGPDLTQPGVLLTLGGNMAAIPLRVEFSGNFRSSVYGQSGQTPGSSANRTRIYRASVDYDDRSTRISAGRTLPRSGISSGYIDGAVVSRRFGDIEIGAGGGFEPSFSQKEFSTDYRRFVLFATFQPAGPLQFSQSLAYSRTWFHSVTDREVFSGSLALNPSNRLRLSVQSDVDRRLFRNSQTLIRPNLTNLFATAAFQVSGVLAVGAGVSAWRPVYPALAATGPPADSLLDTSLRTSPNAFVGLSLPWHVSLSNSFTPRSSESGWGHEYANNTSISLVNPGGSGMMVRGSMNTNVAALTRSVGYGFTIQKSYSDLGDVSLRYQYYRYRISPSEEVSRSKSVGVDLMLAVSGSVSVWGSAERFLGLDANATTFLGELSWRF